MKKFLLVLLSILMVFALASCQQGLTEEEAEALANQRAAEASAAAVDEAVETYKEFVRYKYILEDIVCGNCNLKSLDASTSSTEGVTTVFDTTEAQDFYEAFYGGEENVVEINDNGNITVTQGKVYGIKSNATFKNIVFTVQKYKIHNRKDDTVVKEVSSGETLTITEGYYKVTKTGEEGNGSFTYSMGMTIDGKKYSIKYTQKQEGLLVTYENAYVNDKAVASDLLITENLVDYEDFYPYSR